MSKERAVQDALLSIVSATDLTAKQEYFVKTDSAGKLILSVANDPDTIGVLKNAPNVGGTALVTTLGTSKVSSAEAIAYNAYVTSDANGQAVVATAGEYSFGRAIFEPSTAADQIIEILLKDQIVPTP